MLFSSAGLQSLLILTLVFLAGFSMSQISSTQFLGGLNWAYPTLELKTLPQTLTNSPVWHQMANKMDFAKTRAADLSAPVGKLLALDGEFWHCQTGADSLKCTLKDNLLRCANVPFLLSLERICFY